MILQKYLEVNITSKNMKYYRELGYNIPKKGIYSIKISDVQNGSKVLEDRKCDCCGKTVTRIHRAWIDSFNCYGKDVCANCGKELMKEKVKQTNLQKYGVEYPMQSKEIKQKAKQTTLEHYGVEFAFQDKEIRDKKDKNFEEKHGVKNPQQVQEFKEKTKKTNLKKYGSENVFGSTKIKEEIKKINLKNYGVENPSQLQIIKDKKKQTVYSHYGVEYPLQSEELREKAKQTWLNNLGVDNPLKSKEVREKGLKTLLEKGSIPTSKQQIQVFELCQTLFPNYCVKLNFPLSTLFLDIVLEKEDIKIDIEYDGSYWHQDINRDRRRDEFVKNQGYKVLRIKSNRLVPTKEQLVEAINYLIKNHKNFSKIVLSDYKGD